MSGAYVAKPAAEVPVDYPPGWDISWPWIGPIPPGFDWEAYANDEVPPPEENDDEGNPKPRIWVSPVAGLHTNEHDDGTWSEEDGAAFWVCLTRPPSKAPITVPFVSSDDAIGDCTPSQYTFTTSDWSTPRRIMLVGHNNAYIDGDNEYGIMVGPSTSSYAGTAGVDDTGYNGIYGNNAEALDITSYEEVNHITFYVRDVEGYGSIAHDGDDEDYVEIHGTIYQAAPGTSTAEEFVEGGVAIADGWTKYYADGSKEHGGSAQGTSYTGFYVEADVTEDYSYACVSSIRIGGEVGTTDDISCKGQAYFNHGEVGLGSYSDSESHENADFGDTSHCAHCILHNNDTDGATKLQSGPSTYIEYASVTLRAISDPAALTIEISYV